MKLTKYLISIGDSNRGYDTAQVTKNDAGKYRLIPGTISGRKYVITKSIAALNRGENSYVSKAGDYFQIHAEGKS